MKITLYLSPNRRETELSYVLTRGFERHGEKVEYIPNSRYKSSHKTDLAVFVGVKSRKMFQMCKKYGTPVLMIDKAYFKRKEYYRFSLGDYQPPYFDALNYDSYRLINTMGIALKPRVERGNLIVYAGSSEKYCCFHGLGSAHDYARAVCGILYERFGRKKVIVYRPKPSWWAYHVKDKKEAIPPNTILSGTTETLADLLPRCHCLVTHGSNSAVEALVAGVPVIMLSEKGVSPIHSLCETLLENVKHPYWPSDNERLRVMSNLAHCQFNMGEIASGLMWEELKPWYGYKE